MSYRYCESCNKWYETSEYTVDDQGETVCRVDDHKAVTGFIQPSRHFEPEVRLPYGCEDKAMAQAREQGLVE